MLSLFLLLMVVLAAQPPMAKYNLNHASIRVAPLTALEPLFLLHLHAHVQHILGRKLSLSQYLLPMVESLVPKQTAPKLSLLVYQTVAKQTVSVGGPLTVTAPAFQTRLREPIWSQSKLQMEGLNALPQTEPHNPKNALVELLVTVDFPAGQLL